MLYYLNVIFSFAVFRVIDLVTQITVCKVGTVGLYGKDEFWLGFHIAILTNV